MKAPLETGQLIYGSEVHQVIHSGLSTAHHESLNP